jgi:hypothetical protein
MSAQLVRDADRMQQAIRALINVAAQHSPGTLSFIEAMKEVAEAGENYRLNHMESEDESGLTLFASETVCETCGDTPNYCPDCGGELR